MVRACFDLHSDRLVELPAILRKAAAHLDAHGPPRVGEVKNFRASDEASVGFIATYCATTDPEKWK